ncbi:NAD(P)-binding protein [Periconia macrospinosa]|uniref:NAD(P)-binding protein n=1 Tax=Periconia macrospinosa TaxID=97972 RepID=A0A2V1D7S8_9PLEO|nr:NAD(P)-binding protein [Periconia macrospinosa]
MPQPQKTYLITGTSSGFGLALVHALLARGERVVATARKLSSISHLEETNPNVRTLELDVTSSQEEIDRVVGEAVGCFGGGIDVLVNNAAYLQGGPLEICGPEKFLEVYNTNVVGTVKVTRAIMPHFRAKRSGVVVFMGSIAGWSGEVGAAAYCASKFALEGIYESFAKEAALFNITSLIINPGYFRTQLFSPTNVRIELQDTPDNAYAPVLEQMSAFAKAIDGNQPGDPAKAAERIVDVLRGEGVAEGKKMPKRLILGGDTVEIVRGKCEETLKEVAEWEEVSLGTGF